MGSRSSSKVENHKNRYCEVARESKYEMLQNLQNL